MATAHPTPIPRQPASPAARPRQPERSSDEELVRHMKRIAFVAIPAFVLLWVGVVALAVTFSDVGYEAPLAMGAGVGLLAGIFWAGWYGFVAFGHHEEAERRASRAATR